jgi:hypothetical protein
MMKRAFSQPSAVARLALPRVPQSTPEHVGEHALDLESSDGCVLRTQHCATS